MRENEDDRTPVDLPLSRAALGSLFVVWAGWLWLAAVWMPEGSIVLPQPIRLVRQMVSILIG